MSIKKVAILTDQGMGNSTQMGPVTYKDNILSSVRLFIESTYPWLDANIDYKIAESDPEESTALVIGTVPLNSGTTVVQFPVQYSDGEFLDVPGFFIPNSDMWVNFTEAFYNKIQDSMSDEVTMGTSLDMNGVDSLENMEFENNLGSDLFVDTTGTKYSSLVNILSNISKHKLASFIKTASNINPNLLNVLYPSFKISDIKSKTWTNKPLKKKANKGYYWRPNVSFHKVANVLDLSSDIVDRLGINKSAAVEELNALGVTAAESESVIAEELDTKSLLHVNNEAQLVNKYDLENKANKLLKGKSMAFIDVCSGDTFVVARTKGSVLINNSYGEEACKGSCGGHNNGYGNEKGNPIPSYNEYYANNRYAEDFIHTDKPNYMINMLGISKREKVLKGMFSEVLNIKHFKTAIKTRFGSFTTNKVYNGELPSIPYYYNSKIYRGFNTDKYPEKYVFKTQNLGNGTSKISVMMPISSDAAEDAKDFKKKAFDIYFDTETGVITKVKDPEIHKVVSFKDGLCKTFSVDSFTNEVLVSNITNTYNFKTIKFTTKNGNNVYFVDNKYDSVREICKKLKNYKKLVKDSFSDTSLLTVKYDQTEHADKEGVYNIIYKSKPGFGSSVALEKTSRAKAVTLLASLGFSNSNISNMLKRAELKDNVDFAIKPKMPEEVDKEQALNDKEYELMDKQLTMMFEFIKNKFDEIETGIATSDDIITKQLELHENKLDSIDEMSKQLNEVAGSLQDVVANLQAPAEQAPTPESAAPVPTPRAPQPAQGPTLDPQTAQLLIQSISDPNVAAQNGFDPATVQMIQAAMSGDQNAAAQLGLSQADIDMLNGASAAPVAPPAMPSAMTPSQGGQAPVPGDINETANNLVAALFDSSIAQQMGLTEQDKQGVMSIISNPDMAIQSGEDPNLVNAVMQAYNMMAGSNNMMNSMPMTGGQGAPMPMTTATQPASEQLSQTDMAESVPVVDSASMLLDMLPRIKSSKLFLKYSADFKKMMSILGEILFSLQYQSAKYKKLMGEDSFTNTIDTLSELYENFGDFILKMYTIDK